MNKRTTTMRDLGEKRFLAGVLPTLAVHPTFVNGFGHDASVVDLGFRDVDFVMKIDQAAKPIASLNGWADFRVWGRMAVTANCSDILAVGGAPKAFMLAISVAGDTPAETVAQIIAGAAEECSKHGVAFLGGDTKEAVGVNIVGTAFGTIAKGRHFDRRDGERGDLLVLAGELGGFLGGYRTCESAVHAEGEALRYLSEPTAAWAPAGALSQLGGIRSACDLSDGFASAALNVVAPGNGAMLMFDNLPFNRLAIENAATREVDIINYAFGVGDWGILYAIDPAARRDIEALMDAGLAISIVGEVIDTPGLFITRDRIFAVSVGSNEHFRQRMEDQGSYFDELESGLVLTAVDLSSI